MAIDTTNKKVAVMEWEDVWEPGLPIVSTSTIDQADKQQLLWGYSGILWTTGTVLAYIQDLNTRLRQYLAAFYGMPETSDLSTMMVRYLAGLSGDYSNRLLQLIRDATP